MKKYKKQWYEHTSKGERKNSQPYPLDVKRQAVAEYMAGGVTYRQLSARYGATPHVIHTWVKGAQGQPERIQPTPRCRVLARTAMTPDELRHLHALQARLNDLEQALAKQTHYAAGLEKIIALAEEQFHINIRKKSAAKQSSGSSSSTPT